MLSRHNRMYYSFNTPSKLILGVGICVLYSIQSWWHHSDHSSSSFFLSIANSLIIQPIIISQMAIRACRSWAYAFQSRDNISCCAHKHRRHAGREHLILLIVVPTQLLPLLLLVISNSYKLCRYSYKQIDELFVLSSILQQQRVRVATPQLSGSLSALEVTTLHSIF